MALSLCLLAAKKATHQEISGQEGYEPFDPNQEKEDAPEADDYEEVSKSVSSIGSGFATDPFVLGRTAAQFTAKTASPALSQMPVLQPKGTFILINPKQMQQQHAQAPEVSKTEAPAKPAKRQPSTSKNSLFVFLPHLLI